MTWTTHMKGAKNGIFDRMNQNDTEEGAQDHQVDDQRYDCSEHVYFPSRDGARQMQGAGRWNLNA